MKKTLTLILSLFLALSLFSCNNKENSNIQGTISTGTTELPTQGISDDSNITTNNSNNLIES